ncbi:peptide synthetase [Microbacterium sp. B35-04]|nr:peptide synthetase [Microbacterium sp. B35-04]
MLGGILLLVMLGAAWVGIRGALAYSHLRDAQQTAAAVRESLADPATASAAITSLAADTGAAHALTSDPVWSLAEGVPWVGPQLAAVATVAESLDGVASTALRPLSEVAGTFQVDALRPQGGRLDLAPLQQISGAAETATDGVGAAAASVSAIDRTALVAPVRTAVDEVDGLLTEAGTATDALARATQLIPSMLGAEAPRNYLVLFQNNAEWRSLAGIPGAMALIHTEGGALSLAAQESSSDYERYDEAVLPLGDEITAIYGDRPARWIQNVTQVPDFAVSATLAREMWAREHGGQQVDGVIALDPVALSYLLQATGPITLPTGDVLAPDTAVPLLLNEVYARYPRPADQDAFFAVAAASVFAKLSSGDVDPAALVTALTRAGDEDRLLLWSAHDEEQRLLAGTTLAGGLPESDDGAARFGVYVNDGTGSKMDFYQNAVTTLAWDACTVDASGAATGDAVLTVTIGNTAPADAANLPAYITGAGGFGVPAGITRTIGYLYLPEGFELVDATMSDGSGFGGGMHDGRRVVSFAIDLTPGASATATVTARASTPVAATLEAVTTPTLTPPAAVAAVCGGS